MRGFWKLFPSRTQKCESGEKAVRYFPRRPLFPVRAKKRILESAKNVKLFFSDILRSFEKKNTKKNYELSFFPPWALLTQFRPCLGTVPLFAILFHSLFFLIGFKIKIVKQFSIIVWFSIFEMIYGHLFILWMDFNRRPFSPQKNVNTSHHFLSIGSKYFLSLSLFLPSGRYWFNGFNFFFCIFFL